MKSALASLCVVLLVLGSLGPVAGGGGESEDDGKIADWTVIVYQDADNNLEEAAVHDFNEMEVAGSTEQVNIVVQFDRSKEYDTTNGDWTTAKRFLVEKDDLNGEFVTTELTDIGEVDMGDPDTLANFTIWAIDNYPAEHYLLDLWNHGGAFWGAEWDDDPNGTPAEGSDSDWISMPDLSEAMAQITTHLGRNIDLLAFDACLMADFDVLYEARHYSDYVVASGYVEPGEGWPYDLILTKLVENPQMGPTDLGRIICDDYIDSYTDKANDPQDTTALTMALFDSQKISALGHELDLMGMVLAMNSDANPVRGHYFQIQRARDVTNSYDFPTGYAPGNQIPIDGGGYCMYDVIDLMDNIMKFIPMDSQVNAQAQAVKKAAKEAILYYRATGYQDTVKGANGLTIYFPSGSDTTYSDRYDPTAMANETYWDDFLHYYHSKKSATTTPPSIRIDTPKDGEVFKLDRGVFSVSGTAFDFQNDVGKVEYSVDGGEWKTAGGSTDWSFVLDTRTLGKGSHNIEVRAADGSGTSGAVPVVILIEEPLKETGGGGGAPGGYGMFAGIALFVVLIIVGAFALGWFRRKKK